MKQTRLADLTTILIAGGISERMWPFTDKCFIAFCGKPLLYHAVAQLERVGLRRITIVGNHLNMPAIKLLHHQFPKVALTPVMQEGRGMAQALLSAARAGIKGPIIVRTPHDIIDDVALTTLFDCLEEEVDGAILGKKMDKYFPGGYVIHKDHLVQQIVEKPKPEERPSDMVTIVTHYFADAKHMIQSINTVRSEKDDLYERALTKMINSGFKIKCVAYNGPWSYLKYPWHVLNVMDYFLGQQKTLRIAASAKIHPSVTIDGAVIIEDGVVINSHSSIVGPSFIGRNTIIGNSALVRQSHIGAHCVVGFSTEVVRSYVGDHTWFHKNYIGDSVIGSNVALGSGAVTANIRLDEREISSTIKKQPIETTRTKLGALISDNVRIGINTSLMPGIKIGKGSFVAAGIVLTKDVQDGTFVSMKEKITSVKNTRDVNATNRELYRSKIS